MVRVGIAQDDAKITILYRDKEGAAWETIATFTEGEPNWMERKPGGRLPAPPHDASGHTWHHADAQLFGIVKNGVTPYAGPGYQSDMPAFKAILSDDEILAVLAYIKQSWPQDIQNQQRQISEKN